MATLTVTPANISATEERGAVLLRAIAAVNLSLAHPCVYLDDNNQLNPALASTSLKAARAIGLLVFADNFYAENTILAGNYATYVAYGPWYMGPNSLLIDGKEIWVGKTGTAGDLVDTAPTTPAYQFAVGRAEGNDTIFVSPGTTAPVSV